MLLQAALRPARGRCRWHIRCTALGEGRRSDLDGKGSCRCTHHRASSPATTTLTALSWAGDDEADDVLMARIAAGNQAAFHVFARRHVARYLAVAQRIIGNSSDA